MGKPSVQMTAISFKPKKRQRPAAEVAADVESQEAISAALAASEALQQVAAAAAEAGIATDLESVEEANSELLAVRLQSASNPLSGALPIQLGCQMQPTLREDTEHYSWFISSAFETVLYS